jgi:hypothetical protein
MAEGVAAEKAQGFGGTGVEVGSPCFGGDWEAWRDVLADGGGGQGALEPGDFGGEGGGLAEQLVA